ncbi:dihydrolipoamide acetyltransferase family protein [Tissierella sp. Yu-01]|uniref:dihydrolipoamide acetyltransferase family protein n=1 Tax=Tissierella sp. Yu-01 TaxID=3035694 RepID=UPI00240E9370|nr:dihydrolipoamide acetyltransferase family protein [Tissierella sp. Yu-01]WFA08277.1 dihydrolipoamide acetyltransferase family protein [Tissierella sp. Yu-01]
MKYEFRFPDIGEGIHEGVIMKWFVKPGDEIKEGDSLAEVETDKVTTEIPSPRTGKVLELMAKNGDKINVGQVFITIDTSDGAEAEVTKEVVEEETAGVVGEVIASSEVIPPSTEVIVQSAKSETTKVLATPVARKLAKDLGVDINNVIGTGPNNRVMKEDIYKFKDELETKAIQQHKVVQDKVSSTNLPVNEPITVSDDRIERIPITRIRKTISDRMTQSRFTIPHTTAMDEIDISKLVEFRKKYKDILREEDINLTYLPFIIKAVIVALKKFPEFNASFDMEKEELIFKYFYHIGIATDTERGLMVPVIRDADKMSILELSKAIQDVSIRAKENRIDLGELKGGSFTITNYGSIGGYFGIPIINYPESAILGLGRIVRKPIVVDDEIDIADILPVSLSYDHRIIDGASGARFINVLKDLLSDPDMLFLRA